jgi:pyridoxal 5'-phosphate synthase pdxT subunit
MGTCAGLILLADKVDGQKEGGQMLVGGLNIIASRNYFGAQVKSFEAAMVPPPFQQKEKKKMPYMSSEEESIVNSYESEDEIQNKTFNGIFIRAPAILSVGENVEVLNTINVTNKDRENSEVIVAVRQNNILATAFHPELTNDSRWHQYFIEEIILKQM